MLGVWNVCGWSMNPSHTPRSKVKALNVDIIGLCETFSIKDQEINVEGYKWFGNNGKTITRRAWRESGGVGVLISDAVLSEYEIAIISEVSWANLTHKHS